MGLCFRRPACLTPPNRQTSSRSTTSSVAADIGHNKIFGLVASICAVKTLDEAIALMKAHLDANATSIFTSSGNCGARRDLILQSAFWNLQSPSSP